MYLHDGFHDAIELLKSNRESDYELGFEMLGHQDLANEFQDEFIKLLHAEQNPELRARFVEILGYIERDDILDLVRQELESPHEIVRNWAQGVLIQNLWYQQQIPGAKELMIKYDLFVEEQ